MADSAVEITAGTGTNIDTRTEGTNGNHRQVIVVGDPSTNAGIAPVDATAGLKVDLGADNDVTITSGTITTITNAVAVTDNSGSLTVDDGGTSLTVDGTVTANLSATDNAVLDNIDTSTSAATTALQIIDDWDESDRAKVNLIVGQAGIAAGAGAVAATVPRVTLASDDPAVALLGTIDTDTGNIATNTSTAATRLTNALIGEYETVAASQTDQALGATGGTGDYLAGVLIVPATTSPGAVSIKDGAGSAITIFTGGASSVSNLVPFMIPLGITSGAGAWQITTGANVSAIGIGNFT